MSNTFTAPLSAPVLTVPAAPSEELALDWNKYRPLILASAGLDKIVKIWDCRMLQLGTPTSAVGSRCENRFCGYEYAVRKVQWSPHRPDLIASGAYDDVARLRVLIKSFNTAGRRPFRREGFFYKPIFDDALSS